MKIGVEHLDDLSLGAVFLATGGGGDPHVPQLMTAEVLKQHGPVDVISPEDLADDAHLITIGGVGAPTVSLELLPSIDEAAKTLGAYEAHTGRKVDAVGSFEIGGGNSLIPIMAAAAHGLPVIDGDGMGRAFPEAQMMSYAIAGLSPTPAVAYDYAGNVTCFSTRDAGMYERQTRSLAMASGGMIVTAEQPMSGRELKNCVIPYTLSFAVRLGEALREHRGPAESSFLPLEHIFERSIYGVFRLLYTGKVIDKVSRVTGGYDVGEARIESLEKNGKILKISIKNEYLVAWLDGRVIASVPDLIVIVELETSTPVNAERLKFGQRVAVFAIGCPAFFRSEEALKVVSPRAFGFDLDYVPLEDLA